MLCRFSAFDGIIPAIRTAFTCQEEDLSNKFDDINLIEVEQKQEIQEISEIEVKEFDPDGTEEGFIDNEVTKDGGNLENSESLSIFACFKQIKQKEKLLWVCGIEYL